VRTRRLNTSVQFRCEIPNEETAKKNLRGIFLRTQGTQCNGADSYTDPAKYTAGLRHPLHYKVHIHGLQYTPGEERQRLGTLERALIQYTSRTGKTVNVGLITRSGGRSKIGGRHTVSEALSSAVQTQLRRMQLVNARPPAE